jgi:hypothetical protein
VVVVVVVVLVVGLEVLGGTVVEVEVELLGVGWRTVVLVETPVLLGPVVVITCPEAEITCHTPPMPCPFV